LHVLTHQLPHCNHPNRSFDILRSKLAIQAGLTLMHIKFCQLQNSLNPVVTSRPMNSIVGAELDSISS
jgi:hypothetical protein